MINNNTVEISIPMKGVRVRVPRPDGAPRKLFHWLGAGEALFEIDNSSIESQTTCDRKGEWSLVHSRIGDPSYALTYGGAYHKALEMFYQSLRAGTPPEKDRIFHEVEKVFVASPPPLDNWRTLDKLMGSFERYVQRYQTEDLYGWKILHCEQPFSYPMAKISPIGVIPYPAELIFDNPEEIESEYIIDTPNGKRPRVGVLHINWTGVIDMVVETTNGELWIVDHKTRSIDGDDYWKSFELSQQFLGYTWVTPHLTGLPVMGVLANTIYGREDAKTPAGLKTQREKEFMRRYMHYSPFHIAEWHSNMQRILQDFIHNLQTGYFPMKTHHCTNKFGACPFLDVCTQTSPEARLAMLYTDTYTNNVWNPLS